MTAQLSLSPAPQPSRRLCEIIHVRGDAECRIPVGGTRRKMPKAKGGFKPVTIAQSWSIIAGHMKHAHILETRVVDGSVFTPVCKYTAWLCEAVTGLSARERPLTRTKVVEEMKRRLQVHGHCDQQRTTEETVQDPMDELAYEGSTALSGDIAALAADEGGRQRGKRCRKRPFQQPNVVHTLDMPARCLELYPSETQRVNVVVLATATTLHIRIDCIPWLISYLKDQYSIGSVAVRSREKTPSPLEQQIWWNFSSNAWEATAEACLITEFSNEALPHY